MQKYTAGNLITLLSQHNMLVLNFTFMISYAINYSFWSNMYIIFVEKKMAYVDWSEEKQSSLGFWCMMTCAIGTYFGNVFMGNQFEKHGPRFSLVFIAVFFVMYLIGIFLLNSYKIFDATAFIVALLMGLYDGALANYVWSIINTEFKDRFLALALCSSTFMIYLFIITLTNSLMNTDFDFLVYFLFQAVTGVVAIAIFGYAFEF